MRIKDSKFKSGFSLIEALIAIAILIVGILSAFLLLIRTTATIPTMQARLTAVNLAQEGIEEVRVLRDSYFMDTKNKTFQQFWGNYSCSSGCNISVNDIGTIQLINESEKPLNFNEGTRLYNYYSGSSSIFSRRIIINSSQPDYTDVTVDVTYNMKGKDQTITATDRLYNWLNP